MWRTLYLLSALLTVVTSSGKFRLRMVEYQNPGGKLSCGRYCDEVWFFGKQRGSGCDHVFEICITDYPSDEGRCNVGRVKTGKIPNQDNNVFGSTVGGVANPMTFSFDEWSGAVQIQVVIQDEDAISNDDDVDTVRDTIFEERIPFPAEPQDRSSETEITLRSRTVLKLSYVVYCDPNWHGLECNVYCVSHTDRYTCDRSTGRKICVPGRSGPDCSRSV